MTTLRHKELICIILCIQLKLMTVLRITTLITELFVGVGTLPSFFLKHLHNSIISLSNMIGVSPYDYFGQSPFIGATVQGQESERSCICVGFFYDLCFCFCFVICWGFFFGGWGSTLSVFTIFRQNCGIVLTVYYLLFQLQPIIGDN